MLLWWKEKNEKEAVGSIEDVRYSPLAGGKGIKTRKGREEFRCDRRETSDMHPTAPPPPSPSSALLPLLYLPP